MHRAVHRDVAEDTDGEEKRVWVASINIIVIITIIFI